ncbi:MAG: hypothetical protein ACFFAO_08415 [Candidatus Hermodarchaeota archaeon]
MKIDKWLLDGKTKEEREKLDKLFQSLPQEKVQDLKKKKIRELNKEKLKEDVDKIEPESFLSDIVEFKDWLNQRTYLKGDLDKIEMWIMNLNIKLKDHIAQTNRENVKKNRAELIRQFNKIPVKFLDEKTRLAITKKINGITRTNTDNYYIRKLKTKIQENQNEAHYYKILKKILES